MSNIEEPIKYTHITSGDTEFTVKKEGCVKGTYFLWLNIYDNAGNRSDTRYLKVQVIEPICRIGETVFSTVQEAINTCPTDGTQSKIEMLKNTFK